MRAIIALCVDIPELNGNRIFDSTIAGRFPGSGWASVFSELMRIKNVEVVTGDVALEGVKNGKFMADKIYVIQEMDAVHGKALVRAGAHPFLISCYESPLYAFKFYDRLKCEVKAFEHRLLFSGAFDKIDIDTCNNWPLYFQCFSTKEILPPKRWMDRKYLGFVVSNKFLNEPFQFSTFRKPLASFRSIKRVIETRLSPSWQLARSVELHSKRLEGIEYFGKTGNLELFGSGWNSLYKLSKDWRKRLGPVIEKLKPHPVDDKLKTIADYRFSICFENLKYPGYVTEKIIDCFTAGVIPIYLGAPDIEKIIPNETFIDMRKFISWKELDFFLKSITEQAALQMIEAGRKFLYGKNGQMYSYEGYAEFVEQLLLKKINTMDDVP